MSQLESSDTGGAVSATLKPCPFCGNNAGEETIIDHNEGVAATPWYQGACLPCGFFLEGARDYDEAAAQWNRRAPLSAVTATEALFDLDDICMFKDMDNPTFKPTECRVVLIGSWGPHRYQVEFTDGRGRMNVSTSELTLVSRRAPLSEEAKAADSPSEN